MEKVFRQFLEYVDSTRSLPGVQAKYVSQKFNDVLEVFRLNRFPHRPVGEQLPTSPLAEVVKLFSPKLLHIFSTVAPYKPNITTH